MLQQQYWTLNAGEREKGPVVFFIHYTGQFARIIVAINYYKICAIIVTTIYAMINHILVICFHMTTMILRKIAA